MECLYLIKINEISLKRGNRYFFEKQLKDNVKRKLNGIKCRITGNAGRFFIEAELENSIIVEKALSETFGITAFSRALKIEKDISLIRKTSIEICSEIIQDFPSSTFKIKARRSDKGFPLSSYDIVSDIGRLLLDNFPELKVDVHNPDWILSIEIREKAYLYGPEKKGPGGLPVSCAGKGILLLSGGIDSPVAGYLMAKRGLNLDAVYFHTYPYSSDKAKEKVEKLAGILAPFLCGINLFTVSFTDIQLKIKEKTLEEELTLLMRAAMMSISRKIAYHQGAVCLVTGEALSQVASQTPEAIRYTGSVTDLPIFRPLIGLDKEEIIKFARQIGTFETSILPYDDCCSIFAPKHPLIKPGLDRMKKSFASLNIEELIDSAAKNAEKIHF